MNGRTSVANERDVPGKMIKNYSSVLVEFQGINKIFISVHKNIRASVFKMSLYVLNIGNEVHTNY